MTIHTRSPPQQNPLPWELQKLQQPEKSPSERPAKTAKTIIAVIAVTSVGPFDEIRGKSLNY